MAKLCMRPGDSHICTLIALKILSKLSFLHMNYFKVFYSIRNNVNNNVDAGVSVNVTLKKR